MKKKLVQTFFALIFTVFFLILINAFKISIGFEKAITIMVAFIFAKLLLNDIMKP